VDTVPPWQQWEAQGMHQQSCAQAQALANENLPPLHPMASLARRICETEAASSTVSPLSASAPAKTIEAETTNLMASEEFKLPPLQQSGAEATSPPESPKFRAGDIPTTFKDEEEAADLPPRDTNAGGQQQHTKRPVRPHLKHHGHHNKRSNIFSDFLRDVEHEKEERMRHLSTTWEDDVQKRLHQVHKQTRLMLQLSDDQELKEKRYGKAGHEVFMKSLLKENRSRSDPTLVTEAMKAKKSPEVFQVKKLNSQLYVKPPTPPPAPPPKPKVSDDFGAQFKGLKQAHTARVPTPDSW